MSGLLLSAAASLPRNDSCTICHERAALLAQLGTPFRNGLQAVIILPGGVGSLTWGSTHYHEHVINPTASPRFTPCAQCPALVRAMLISHAGRMLESLMQEVRLLGS